MQAFLELRKAKKAEPDRVQLGGLVAAPRALTFFELSTIPMTQQVPDVRARVPGREGRAVQLGALLDMAQPQAGATHVQVSTADGSFTSSVSLEEARRGLLVYAVDGGPLPAERGGPFRLLIPEGSDRCANVKAVGSIEVTAASGAKTASAC
ncbi:MAG: molybdopterin-dependent oxidoreductase [Planctomycetota bacterium]